MEPVPRANGENFSLADFFAAGGRTLEERVKPFSAYFRAESAEGRALYSRQLVGPVGGTVLVADPLSGNTRRMIMLGSNNYLGLANDPYVIEAAKRAIDQYGVGVAGPPLLNGMTSIHRELELRIAALKGCEDALLFASGFQANMGWVAALLRRDDVLVYDELHHASLYDAVKLATARGTGVVARRFRHNDCDHLEKTLQTAGARRGQVFVAVEGVYSMDGDIAPLKDIRSVCDRHGAQLVVDDAHGTGVLGDTGGGTVQQQALEGRVDLEMGTFSKALATSGGFLAGSRALIDYLRFFSRSYMFSAHLPPPVVGAVLAGVDIIEGEPARRELLRDAVRYLVSGLSQLGIPARADAAIVPIFVPADIDIRVLNLRLHEAGIFLNSIEPPAVPVDSQRLRLSLMATHTRDDLDHVLAAFQSLRTEFPSLAPGR